MSWFSGANPMDELVERATDGNLPSDSEDLALNLEICDRIRSKSVPAKDAMRSLKKRVSNKNPNIQLLALNLCDLCVKNGGSHFLIEIASREFVDNLVSLLRAPQGINQEVRQRILELVQSWALAFESRNELGYMPTTYKALRQDGIQFPPEERIAAAFVDTAAPPDWADSDVCMRCRTAFSFRNRKHHCRNCGNVFCGQCSTQTMTLPHLGINEPVRVCDGCHAKRMQSSLPAKGVASNRHDGGQHQRTSSRAAGASDHEDLDLKRALELSLEESKRGEQTKPVRREVAAPPTTDDEDAEFKAAIAASLRESTPVKSQNTFEYPTLQTKPSSQSYTPSNTQNDRNDRIIDRPTAQPPINNNELQPSEQENIKLFATLVDRLKTDSQGTILRDPQIQELYDSISELRPKLVRSLRDTVGKYESLVETHSKLATVVKYYDRMLESRLASTYGRGPYNGSGAYDSMPNDNYSRPSNDYYSQPQGAYHNYSQGSRPQAQPGQDDPGLQKGYYGQHANEPSQPYGGPGRADYVQQTTHQPSQVKEPVQPQEEVSLIDL